MSGGAWNARRECLHATDAPEATLALPKIVRAARSSLLASENLHNSGHCAASLDDPVSAYLDGRRNFDAKHFGCSTLFSAISRDINVLPVKFPPRPRKTLGNPELDRVTADGK